MNKHFILLLTCLLVFAACGGGEKSSNTKDKNEQALTDSQKQVVKTRPDGPTGNDSADHAELMDSLGSSIVNNTNTLDSDPSSGGPDMVFVKETHDFGDIEEGLKVQYHFEFSNPGTAPLIVSDARGSCGCTVPEVPQHPIMPGKSSHLLVTYDSKGRSGTFEKEVTIQTNANPSERKITVKGKVINYD